MGKGGVGVGSASIVLVFAVLCLTIFSLITLVVARNEKAMIDAKVRLVTSYYVADTQAERILHDILTAETTPETIRGVNIYKRWDEVRSVEMTYFFYPVSDVKSLYVNIVLYDDTFDILSWRMYDTDEWTYDPSLNIWSGVFTDNE